MKKSILKKIETLLTTVYGDTFPESQLQNTKLKEKKADSPVRCNTTPFEFISLIF